MKLGKRDSAIIFKDDGSIECAIPDGGKSGMVSGYAMRALALYHILSEDETVMGRVNATVNEMIQLARKKNP